MLSVIFLQSFLFQITHKTLPEVLKTFNNVCVTGLGKTPSRHSFLGTPLVMSWADSAGRTRLNVDRIGSLDRGNPAHSTLCKLIAYSPV